MRPKIATVAKTPCTANTRHPSRNAAKTPIRPICARAPSRDAGADSVQAPTTIEMSAHQTNAIATRRLGQGSTTQHIPTTSADATSTPRISLGHNPCGPSGWNWMSVPNTTIDRHSSPIAILSGTRLRVTVSARVANRYS